MMNKRTIHGFCGHRHSRQFVRRELIRLVELYFPGTPHHRLSQYVINQIKDVMLNAPLEQVHPSIITSFLLADSYQSSNREMQEALAFLNFTLVSLECYQPS